MKSINIHTLIEKHSPSYDTEAMYIVETLKDVNVITETRINPQHKKLLRHFPELIHDIRRATAFMPPETETRERIMIIVEGFNQRPTCHGCGAHTTFNSSAKRWNRYCNSRCPHRDARNEEQRISALFNHYHVTNPMRSAAIRSRRLKRRNAEVVDVPESLSGD